MEAKVDAYRPGDEQEILELFARVFNKKKDETCWRWENMDNPCGESLFALLKEKGRVHGHLCLQPVHIKAGNEALLCGQRINSMIEKDYRHQDLFEEMFQHLLDQARARQVAIIFGFPNAQSFRALQKIYPTEAVARVPRYIKFYQGRTAASRKIDNPALARLAGLALQGMLRVKNRRKADTGSVKPVNRFDKRFDRLWLQSSRFLEATTIRDSAYLNWRYVNSPRDYRVLAFFREDEVLGYIVLWMDSENTGHIVDLLAVQENRVIPSLLSAADDYIRPHCHMLSCWCLDRGQVSRHLRRHGFFSVPSLNTLAVSNISCSKEAAQVLWNKDSWYVMIGDSDYI